MRGSEHLDPALPLLDGEAVVHRVRREQAETTVVMLVVVPVEEVDTEAARVLQRAEARGETRSILQGLNCASENGLSLET